MTINFEKTLHFGNVVLKHTPEHLVGGVNFLSDHVYTTAYRNVLNRYYIHDFKGDMYLNPYLQVIHILREARDIIRKIKTVYHDPLTKSRAIFSGKFDVSVLKESFDFLFHFNGIVRFEEEPFCDQRMSTDDFDYEGLIALSPLFGSSLDETSVYNIDNTHHKLGLYKLHTKKFFEGLECRQTVLTSKIKRMIHSFIYDRLIESADSLPEDVSGVTFMISPKMMKHIKIVESEGINYLSVVEDNLPDLTYRLVNQKIVMDPVSMSKQNYTMEDILESVKREYKCVMNINSSAFRGRYHQTRYFDFIHDYSVFSYKDLRPKNFRPKARLCSGR